MIPEVRSWSDVERFAATIGPAEWTLALYGVLVLVFGLLLALVVFAVLRAATRPRR